MAWLGDLGRGAKLTGYGSRHKPDQDHFGIRWSAADQ
jgi:hypothetical protein